MQARAAANEGSRRTKPATEARPAARTDYLYRGILRCGICGLRMWGNRRTVTYYSCRPASHRSRTIPEDHPRYVYLNEDRLSQALFAFLAGAVFGPDRHAYWQQCLEEAGAPERTPPPRNA